MTAFVIAIIAILETIISAKIAEKITKNILIRIAKFLVLDLQI